MIIGGSYVYEKVVLAAGMDSDASESRYLSAYGTSNFGCPYLSTRFVFYGACCTYILEPKASL